MPQREVRIQWLAHLLAACPAVVLTPYRNWPLARGQAGDQRLVEVTRAINQLLASGPLVVRDPMPQQDPLRGWGPWAS